jgi:hypothetical protein
MKDKIIRYISYIDGDKRIKARSISKKFKLHYVEVVDGRVVQRKFWLSAKDFVEHHRIKDCDPVINFYGGEKMRVYRGGDSSSMVIETAGRIDFHDSLIKKKETKKKKQFTFNESVGENKDIWDSIFYDQDDD